MRAVGICRTCGLLCRGKQCRACYTGKTNRRFLAKRRKGFKRTRRWKKMDMTKFMGDWIKPEEVGQGLTAGIVTPAKGEQGNFGLQAVITIELPDKSQKKWSMNATTVKLLVKGYGVNSVDWVGRLVHLTTRPEKVKGVDRLVIYGQPAIQQGVVPVPGNPEAPLQATTPVPYTGLGR